MLDAPLPVPSGLEALYISRIPVGRGFPRHIRKDAPWHIRRYQENIHSVVSQYAWRSLTYQKNAPLHIRKYQEDIYPITPHSVVYQKGRSFAYIPHGRYQEDIYTPRKISGRHISDARRTRPSETVRSRKIYLGYPSLADWKHFWIYIFQMPVGRIFSNLLGRKNISRIPVPSGREAYVPKNFWQYFLKYFGKIYLRGPSDGDFRGYWQTHPDVV